MKRYGFKINLNKNVKITNLNNMFALIYVVKDRDIKFTRIRRDRYDLFRVL